MRTISFSYRLGVSTVYDIIIEVCNAIIEIIMHEVMAAPNKQKWKEIASEFWTCWNFPNCLGAVLFKLYMIINLYHLFCLITKTHNNNDLKIC